MALVRFSAWTFWFQREEAQFHQWSCRGLNYKGGIKTIRIIKTERVISNWMKKEQTTFNVQHVAFSVVCQYCCSDAASGQMELRQRFNHIRFAFLKCPIHFSKELSAHIMRIQIDHFKFPVNNINKNEQFVSVDRLLNCRRNKNSFHSKYENIALNSYRILFVAMAFKSIKTNNLYRLINAMRCDRWDSNGMWFSLLIWLFCLVLLCYTILCFVLFYARVWITNNSVHLK